MVTKLGRFGKFYAATNFPDCRHTQAIVKEIGVICPQCQKAMLLNEKLSEIVFSTAVIVIQTVTLHLGISRSALKLSKCNHYLVEKKVRGGGKQVVCSNGDYEEEKVK